ncbi:serine-enriched protein isoform X3 [Anopheles gambiae]|uniref:serine-enriched protein isoform X3 n=1 Tax=Anopheles gambiae TaxID=7165 RepID=UPI002AC98173|nr:serine-enriched protein isoform X3 [Anopheles gambiae]
MPEVLPLSGMADAEPDLSTFENKSGLAEDMKFLASMPELCDVTFLVGETREPVCAVKAVLAARSRVFQKMLYQAPSPQRKKEPPPRENKLRLFLKRSSEPLLNLQNAAQQPAGQQHQTLIIEEFEPDVFRQLIEYIHTGCVTLQPRTLLGVMNAADYYGLEELRRACGGFVQCCINVDTVCALLASAERYIQYKCTKSLVQKVLEFVDEHGNEVLNLGSFTLLPQHVVRLILAREELRADEFTKFQAALMWSKKYCDSNQNTPLKEVIGNFLEYIQFHKIPANVLMREVHPLGLVPYSIIMNALAYQADPASVDPGKLSPNSSRHHHHSQHLHQPNSGGSSSSRSLPKIRKAKSQSFRTRRSPSERSSKGGHVSPWNFSAQLSTGTGTSTQVQQQQQQLPKSPVGSMTHLEQHRSSISSAKSPCLSRQGTLRSSHRRKSSLGASLNLSQGRRSPISMLNDRSPSGRPKSPNLLITDQAYASSFDRRSPTAMSFSGRRSPSGLRSPSGGLRSPSGRRSPLGFNLQSEYSELLQSQQDRFSPNSLSSHQSTSGADRRTSPTIHLPPERSRSPVGFGSRLGGSLYGPVGSESRSARTSPTTLGTIPPITISNPSETYEIVQKSIETNQQQQQQQRSPKSPKSPKSPMKPEPGAANGGGQSAPEKKEKTSVMKEILAFVRKPSKKVTTRTSKFAAAFTRTESTTGAPLLRQSTFSSIQNSSSCAGRNAITKQMSEIAFEPIMSSLKWKNVGSKMSLKSLKKLSQGMSVTSDGRSRDKRSSGDEVSDVESSDGAAGASGIPNASEAVFEVLESVHFEKVGEAYIKHDQIREEESPRGSQDSAAGSDDDERHGSDSGRLRVTAVSEIKKSLEALFTRQEPIDEAGETGATGTTREPDAIQCPTFEIEPPSRRASFDPPRSPFLENLRSLSDTDHEGTHHSRLDSGGDSFEMIDTTDRMPGSSVSGDRHSSMDTSFDISRYQSTSYEDQNSSFELVELDNSQRGDKTLSPFDIRKSSIELVDAETFQRSGYPEGRKSSLETHFDLADSYQQHQQHQQQRSASPRSAFSLISNSRAPTRKQISEPGRCRDSLPRSGAPAGTGTGMKTHYSAPHRAKSPLSNQTSSNFSSRDSYDSIFESMPPPPPHYHTHQHQQKSPYSSSDPKQHFPLPPRKSSNESPRFLCTDKRCAAIFEPRPSVGSIGTVSAGGGVGGGIGAASVTGRLSSCYLDTSSGSEFEPPSPRRAASASPKHTFTFRIVLKKVDSSPDAICPSAERRQLREKAESRHKRRDSRRKKLLEIGKSF